MYIVIDHDMRRCGWNGVVKRKVEGKKEGRKEGRKEGKERKGKKGNLSEEGKVVESIQKPCFWCFSAEPSFEKYGSRARRWFALFEKNEHVI